MCDLRVSGPARDRDTLVPLSSACTDPTVPQLFLFNNSCSRVFFDDDDSSVFV